MILTACGTPAATEAPAATQASAEEPAAAEAVADEQAQPPAEVEEQARSRDAELSHVRAVLEEAQAMQKTLPARDRSRMDRYLSDMREVERGLPVLFDRGKW